MSIMESIQIALEGLVANKMRAALTMLGIIIGVSAVIAMLALANGASGKMMGDIQKMGTNMLVVMSGQTKSGAVRGGFGSMETLTMEDADTILTKCPTVVKISPEVKSNAQVKFQNKNTSTSIAGITSDYMSICNYKIDKGKMFRARDVTSARKVAVIGSTTAKDLFGKLSPVGKKITIRGIEFDVIGVLASKGTGGFGDSDDQVMVPVTTAMRRLFGTTHVRTIYAQTVSMDMMDRATSQISRVLRKRHRITKGSDDDFVIRNQQEIMDMANQASAIFTMLLAGIASVSLLVGGIGVMNIMLVSVTERTREIGIRKALGARRRDIQWQFLVEALVLSMTGGVAGIINGFLLSWIVGKISGLNAAVTMGSVLLSFGFAAMVGIFFGYYPARAASRLDPIQCLRYE